MAVIKDKKCMIIGAAPLASGAVFEEFDPKEHYVICADAGYDTAVRYGVRPDLVIGDFDSAAKRPPETIRTIKLLVEKDVTDMMGAVMVGQKLGYKTFVLIGGLGGDRFDHYPVDRPQGIFGHHSFPDAALIGDDDDMPEKRTQHPQRFDRSIGKFEFVPRFDVIVRTQYVDDPVPIQKQRVESGLHGHRGNSVLKSVSAFS